MVVGARPADSHHPRKSLEFSYFKRSFSKIAHVRERRPLTGEVVSGTSTAPHLTWPWLEFLGLCVRLSQVMHPPRRGGLVW